MRRGRMKILGNVFIIFSPFVLMSQVIVWDGLLLAPLYGIVKGHAIWPGKISHLYSLKKNNKINFETTSELAFRCSVFQIHVLKQP